MQFSIMVDKTKRFSMQNQNTESQYLSNDVSIFVWLTIQKDKFYHFLQYGRSLNLIIIIMIIIIRLSECPYCRF